MEQNYVTVTLCIVCCMHRVYLDGLKSQTPSAEMPNSSLPPRRLSGCDGVSDVIAFVINLFV